MTLTVRAVTAAEHRAYIASRPAIALEQTPGWGKGFVAARTESVGWFDGTTMIGAGLYRLRGLPRLPMRSVAVFEAGPDIDWTGRRRPRLSLADWLDPLVRHLRGRGAFTARVTPDVAQRNWWRVDPAQRATRKELLPHQPLEQTDDSVLAARRLADAGWRALPSAPDLFAAEVVLSDSAVAGPEAGSRAMLPGTHVRTGTVDDLPTVHEAVTSTHPGLPHPTLAEWQQRWQGLVSDNLAGVNLVVLERDGAVVYGGIVATVGDRAWDLSAPLPLPDAALPQVQLLRDQVLRRARATGARALVVPVVSPQRRAPVKAPTPGWPPAHLSQLLGTWDYPVRATMHSMLAPVVDHLVL